MHFCIIPVSFLVTFFQVIKIKIWFELYLINKITKNKRFEIVSVYKSPVDTKHDSMYVLGKQNSDKNAARYLVQLRHGTVVYWSTPTAALNPSMKQQNIWFQCKTKV